MTDYSKMSDFEINKLVANHLGKELMPDDCQDMGNAGFGDVILTNGDMKDYCNNPADAWPIITENNISLIFDNPSFVMATSNCVGWYSDEEPPIHSSSNNPLRAAMIVFLMMKGDEKC